AARLRTAGAAPRSLVAEGVLARLRGAFAGGAGHGPRPTGARADPGARLSPGSGVPRAPYHHAGGVPLRPGARRQRRADRLAIDRLSRAPLAAQAWPLRRST